MRDLLSVADSAMNATIMRAAICCLFLFLAPLNGEAFSQSWVRMYPDFPDNLHLAMCHWNGDTVYTAGTGGMFAITTDAGRHWRNLFPGDSGWDFVRVDKDRDYVYLLPSRTHATFAEDTANPARAFLVRYSPNNDVAERVYYPRPYGAALDISVTSSCITLVEQADRIALLQSTDHGVTWETIVIPDSMIASPSGMPSVLFSGRDTGIVVAGERQSWYVMKPYLTTDGGQSWTALQGIEYPITKDTPGRNASKRPGQWITPSAVVLVTGGNVPCVSTDAGRSWRRGAAVPAVIAAIAMHPDGTGFCVSPDGAVSRTSDAWNSSMTVRSRITNMEAICCSPNPASVIVGGNLGLLFSTADGGATWNDTRLPALDYIRNLEFFSADEGACTYKDMVTGLSWYARSFDGGRTWIPRHELTEFWNIVHTSGNVAFGFSDIPLRIFRSTDAGYSWEVCYASASQDSVRFGTSAMMRRSADTLFLNTNRGILVTSDQGATWAMKGAPPNAPYTFHAGFGGVCWAWTNEAVYRSTDDCASWEQLQVLPDTGTSPPWYQSVHPVSANECYVLASVWVYPRTLWHVLHTRDHGENWQDGLLPVGSIIPSSASFFTSGVSHGLLPGVTSFSLREYRLCRSGDEWMTYTEERNYRLHDNRDWQSLYFLDENTGWLVSQSSIYRTTDGGISWTAAPMTLEASCRLLAAYPNPVSGGEDAVWWFDNATGSSVTLHAVLCDIHGRRVATLHDGTVGPGRSELRWTTETAARGVYRLSVVAGGRVHVQPVVVR